jgi:hypothetical protein
MSSWDDLAIKQRTLVKHAGLTWFNHLFGIWPMNAMAHRGYDGHILTGDFCWDIFKQQCEICVWKLGNYIGHLNRDI